MRLRPAEAWRPRAVRVIVGEISLSLVEEICLYLIVKDQYLERIMRLPLQTNIYKYPPGTYQNQAKAVPRSLSAITPALLGEELDRGIYIFLSFQNPSPGAL